MSSSLRACMHCRILCPAKACGGRPATPCCWYLSVERFWPTGQQRSTPAKNLTFFCDCWCSMLPVATIPLMRPGQWALSRPCPALTRVLRNHKGFELVATPNAKGVISRITTGNHHSLHNCAYISFCFLLMFCTFVFFCTR